MTTEAAGLQRDLLGPGDYLQTLPAAAAAVRALRAERLPRLAEPRFAEPLAALAALPALAAKQVTLATPVVEIGTAAELSPPDQESVRAAARALMPWKKGPFSLFGLGIDAEWRSDWKWQRLAPHLPPLAGRRIADIGCNNGYFMLRAAAAAPALVVGFEPEPRHWLEFSLLQRFARVPGLVMEPLGAEHMDLYPGCFDVVLCLGILYHHTDPVGLLRKIFVSLAKGGHLIAESQGIAGNASYALVPEGRYARARGVWFVPTRACLETWLRRAGFVDVACFYDEPLSVDEQRRTDWAPGDSLAEFLDADDPQKTVEGHPAPRRIYLKARRP